MRILSLPKYKMTARQWIEALTWPIVVLVLAAFLYDGCHIIYKEDQLQAQQYQTCKPVCYPHPVNARPMSKEGECICNTSVEYRKP